MAVKDQVKQKILARPPNTQSISVGEVLRGLPFGSNGWVAVKQVMKTVGRSSLQGASV